MKSLAQLLALVDLSPPLTEGINLLILKTVVPVVLLISRDPFFLSVIPRTLKVMIPLIWMKSSYAGMS